MQIIKKFKLLLFSLLFISLASVFAYDNLVIHPKLTQAAINIYNESSSDIISKQEAQAIIFGSIAEDTDPRYLHHFYNPETKKGLKGKWSSAKEWAYHQPSATGDYSVDAILENYRQGDIARAYEGVGHILHLIQDMSVPAHTRDDAHGEGDPFEEWAKIYGQVDVSQIKFIEVNDINQVFDDLAKYSHDNFFSKDTINNVNDYIIVKEYITKDYYKEYIAKKIDGVLVKLLLTDTTALIPFYEINDNLIHQDYWKMLYPKAVGYSAGIIDYFQKEFAKIDQENKEKKISFWNKVKKSFSNARYNWGDRIFYYHLAFNSIFNHISGKEGQPDPWQQFTDNFSQSNVLGNKDNNLNQTKNSNPKSPIISIHDEKVKISYVIDGDTFVLENGEKVRYIGIDSPELNQPGPEDDECLAWVARLRNMQLLSKGEVTLVKDPDVDKDKYGRLLRYVYVNDVFVNEVMAREGLAETFFCQPGWKNCPIISDNKRKEIIISASQYAQDNNIGIFGSACSIREEKNDFNNKEEQVEADKNDKNEEDEDDNQAQTHNYFFPNNQGSYRGINTTILQHPKPVFNSSQADFKFNSTRSDANYQCNLDSVGWQKCHATSSWFGLSNEFHNIKVRSYLNEDIDLTPAEFDWLVDTNAPTSSINSLLKESENGFQINWQGEDMGKNASGISGFDIQYKEEKGEWQDWLLATTSTSSNFNIAVEGGQQICFRSRAIDYANNYEEWPEKADACTYLLQKNIPQLDYFYLQSLTSTSTSYTASTTVGLDYSITNQEFVNTYLFSSSSSTPLDDNNNWATSTPFYFTLSAGDGEKQVYFWVKHHGSEITYLGSAKIILDTVAPNAPTITNIIPQSNIYWVATTTSQLVGEKDEGTNQILINKNIYSVQASSANWNLMYEFGFTGDGLEKKELARADFWACLMVVPPIANFQRETLNIQARDEAGNLSDTTNYDFQMDVYAPTVTYFDALGNSADGYIYLNAQAIDNYMGGSDIKEYKFEYKELGQEEWQELSVSSWNSGIYNYRASLPPGDYDIHVIVYDWAGNISSSSEEKRIISNPRPVLSEIYGGGGNSGSYWKNDFIELYNPTDNEIFLDGWSIQYASANSSNWSITALSGSIASHGYYLIEEHQGSEGEISLPIPDISGNINLSAFNGKIALVSNTENITGLSDEDIIDFVGYGSANEFEGGGGAPNGSNTSSIERKARQSSTERSMGIGGTEEFSGNGYDSNENNVDWLSRNLPEPQNIASSAELL